MKVEQKYTIATEKLSIVEVLSNLKEMMVEAQRNARKEVKERLDAKMIEMQRKLMNK